MRKRGKKKKHPEGTRRDGREQELITAPLLFGHRAEKLQKGFRELDKRALRPIRSLSAPPGALLQEAWALWLAFQKVLPDIKHIPDGTEDRLIDSS